MIEKIGHIKNPLTVIALFSAIAEISGTTVLPFIESKNQEIYIWFLMAFPFYLTGVFFLILNFNHKVLYSPSDYKDEINFLKTFDKELTKIEKATKELNEKVKYSTVDQNDFYLDVRDRILRIAEVSPRAAISEAWREVEIVTNSLLQSYGYEPKNVQMSKVFRNIVHENGYPWSFYEEYRQLMKLRNQAVHAEEFDLNKEEAERYIHTALNLAVFITKLSKDAPNKANSVDAKSRAAD